MSRAFACPVLPHLWCICYHGNEKLASCHISVVLVLLLQSFLPLPSNTSSPSSGFPEKMTGFPAQQQGELEQENELGFPLPAPSQAVQGIQNMHAAQSLTPAFPLLFGEKEVKQHPRVGFSLLAGHRRTAQASEGVIFFFLSLSMCITQNLEVFLLSHIQQPSPGFVLEGPCFWGTLPWQGH